MTYLSDNGSIIQFNKSLPYYVAEYDLNSVPAEYDSFRPAGVDGAYTTGASYAQKIITASGTIVGTGRANLDDLRARLSAAMNVHHEGWLIVELFNGKKRKIRCRPNQSVNYPKPAGWGQPYNLEWLCDKPYWLDYADTILPIGQVTPLWCFPFCGPVLFGHSVAEVSVYGNAAIEIPLKIEIMSQATLITLENLTTGEYLAVSKAIGENEKMVIDGAEAQIYLQNLLTGATTNANNRLEAGSTFFTLTPGKQNRITLNNGVTGATPLAYIIYNGHSLAV